MRFGTVLFLLVIFLSGCLGPKKIDKWVNTQYGESVSARSKTKNDYISVTSNLVTNDQKTSVTTKKTKNLLPLLFYWQMDYINTCALNPAIPVNAFTATVQSYANSKGLKQKLNGQKLALSVEKVPNTFQLYDRGHMIWVIYAFAWDNISFQPDNQQMVVSYKINKDEQEVKTGIITIPNADKVLRLKYFQSTKKATAEYLSQYDESIKAMSKKVLDKLMMEI